MSDVNAEKLRTVKLESLLDRRRKLTDEDKYNIRRLYEFDHLKVREIARMYEKVCSRRLIQFVLFPERLKTLQDRNRKNQHWKKYYNREQLTKAVRNLRRYKTKLYNEDPKNIIKIKTRKK